MVTDATGTEQPILILGCPRSGTTLLRLMLNAHSRIAIPPETRFVLPTYYGRARFGDLQAASSRRALAEFVTDTQRLRFADLETDADAAVEAIVAGAPTVGSALSTLFQQYAARFDKPRWGDKLPTYIEHVDVLRRLWPQAKLVHVVRDGRDCVASIKRQEWSRRTTPEAIARWNRAIDHGRRAARRVPAQHWLQLRYESLVSEPEAQLRRLCEFLDEEFEPAMLEPHKVAASAMRGGKQPRGKLSEAVTTSSIGGWERELSGAEAALMHAASGRRLASLGYTVPTTNRPEPKAVAAFVQAQARHRAKATLEAGRDALQRRTERRAGRSVAAGS